jgi:hypothetical protein
MRIKKFNGGEGAILCNGCRVIVKEGWGDKPSQISKADWESDEPVACNRCQRFKQAEEILSKVKLGMNRREVVAALGEPTDVSVARRRKQPGIYKYGEIELHFGPKWDGTLWLVYSEDGRGDDPVVHAKC